MGSYAECWVDNLKVTSSKNSVDPSVMNLLRGTSITVRRFNDPDVPSQIKKGWSRNEEDEQPGDEFEVIYYECSIALVRDRLELEGYTIANARRLFEEWRVLEIQRQVSWKPVRIEGNLELTEILAADRAVELRNLRDLSVDKWISYLRRINDDKLTWENQKEHESTFIGEMLKAPGQQTEGWYGYQGPDSLVGIRLALEALPDAATFIYELTDLYQSGYLRNDEDPMAQVIDSSTTDIHTFGRTVLLTEGRSDAWILRDSMALLYPHLVGYFSFMDFTEFRVGGGAGQLANLVKAFAGAGIVNRVIAIFDNDAASAAALRLLLSVRLPRHIVPLQLPNLASLRSYPTLGPAGPAAVDVNGMAASIELYLGNDVLRDVSGDLAPVQWTGFEPTLRTYQGELLAKAEVQARFKEKLARARVDAAFMASADWSGLQHIFGAVFHVFHALDADLMSASLRDYYGEIGDN
jgi:hypothetical protein